MNKVITFSELSIALDCLRKYKYVVIDRLDSGLDLVGDIKFGSAMHSAITASLEGEDGMDVFQTYWGALQNKGLKYTRYDWAALALLGKDFMRKFIKMYLPDLKPLHMEKRLAGEYKGIQFEGTPDFVGYYKDELVLLDWKTTGSPYDKNKALTSMQLMLYAYLVRENYKLPLQKVGFLPFVKSSGSIQKPVFMDYTSSESLMEDIKSYVDAFKTAKDYPRNLNKCIGCNFIDKCHKGEI